MSKYLGDVSAYAYAASKGYTGTEEEFAELMASYATVGQTAVDAAESALNSKTVAQTAATTATNKASEATTAATTATTKASEASASAQTASTKASEASQSASTASQKATEASQSASQASGYATAAESAKTASQTAQTAAETARTGAETAQGLAEDARDLAQRYAESINPENIFSAYPTDTASGSIASFFDGADNIPLKSLVVDINPVQDTSSGGPSPENICPIIGWTGANVVASGKNLWDKVNGGILNGYIGSTDIVDSTSRKTAYIRCAPNTTYTMSKTRSIAADRFYVAYTKDITAPIVGTAIFGTVNAPNSGTVGTQTSCSITTGADAKWLVCWFSWDTSVQTDDINSLQFELGSSASSYESFNGTTIPISWQTEAGTVYGGKLDVLTGILTVYPYYASYNGETLTGRWISDRDVYAVGTTPTIGAQVVNIGAQGTEIQLSPHEVKSLLGQNNIFADTGDTEVEYRADTKMYIERLTEPDADMIADANIVSGSYFMVGNSLYLATANIASGSAVIVGTNAIRKSLSEALNEINS